MYVTILYWSTSKWCLKDYFKLCTWSRLQRWAASTLCALKRQFGVRYVQRQLINSTYDPNRRDKYLDISAITIDYCGFFQQTKLNDSFWRQWWPIESMTSCQNRVIDFQQTVVAPPSLVREGWRASWMNFHSNVQIHFAISLWITSRLFFYEKNGIQHVLG